MVCAGVRRGYTASTPIATDPAMPRLPLLLAALTASIGLAACAPDSFRNYEARMLQGTQIFAGVPELVAALGERRLAWGVVTNKASRFTVAASYGYLGAQADTTLWLADAVVESPQALLQLLGRA